MRPFRLLMWALAVLALAPAVTLTVLRVLTPTDGRWVRLTSFAPLAVPLYVFAAMLLLVLAASAKGPRAVVLVPLAGCLALLGLHAWWLAPAFVGDKGEGAEPFRVMTANLMHGAANAPQIVLASVEHDVDVVVLEEVTPQVLETLDGSGLTVRFPYSAGEDAGGVDGTMVFSRLPLSGVTPLPTSSGGYRVRVAAPGGPVTLFAVHPRPPKGDALVWRTDHAVIRAAVGKAPNGATLVVGDLNATTDHEPVRLLEADGFRTASEVANSGWQPTWPANGRADLFGFGVPPLVQIDHVLIDDHFAATRTWTVEIEGTDHRAVIAELRVG